MPVITVASQLGSGGEQIASQAARQTGARLLDGEILQRASERTGIPVRHFEKLDERGRSMLRHPGDLLRLVPLPPINPELPDVFGDRYPPTGPVRARGEGLQSPIYWAAEAYAAAVSATIQAAAQEGDVVVVGRGGNEALAGTPGGLRVLVVASEPQRVRRVMADEGVDAFDALDRVRESDRRRRAYVRQFYGADWLDPTRYDLVVRTDSLADDAAAAVIVAAAQAAAQAAGAAAAQAAALPAEARPVTAA
jgi:cytidylate kinase